MTAFSKAVLADFAPGQVVDIAPTRARVMQVASHPARRRVMGEGA